MGEIWSACTTCDGENDGEDHKQLRPQQGKFGGTGPQDTDHEHSEAGKAWNRTRLRQIAEDNYNRRAEWTVPRTFPVKYAEAMAVKRSNAQPVISFSGMNTTDAILRFLKSSDDLVVALNFANGRDVGGGYKTGATAQEEDLCRSIPCLYPSLLGAQRSGLYPFGPSTATSRDDPQSYSDVLYTQGLVVARSSIKGDYKLMPKEQQKAMSLVTAAAPNVNFANDLSDNDLMYKTIEAVFATPLLKEAAAAQGKVTLILGAWGCGAFGGKPDEIGVLFAKALENGLGNGYREVHFAIPVGNNHDGFKEALRARNLRIKDII